MVNSGWIFLCVINHAYGTATPSNSTTDSTTSTSTPVAGTDSSSSSYVVEVVIVGCAILLLLIATLKIGFLLRSSSPQRRREGMLITVRLEDALRYRPRSMCGMLRAPRSSEISKHFHLFLL